jgi:hypothetical protein
MIVAGDPCWGSLVLAVASMTVAGILAVALVPAIATMIVAGDLCWSSLALAVAI